MSPALNFENPGTIKQKGLPSLESVLLSVQIFQMTCKKYSYAQVKDCLWVELFSQFNEHVTITVPNEETPSTN